QRDFLLAAGEHRRLHEPGAPDRARAAADVLGHEHRDLQQHRADVALVDLIPLLVDHAEAGGERGAEVTVAGETVEVRKVVLVAQHGRAGGPDRALDLLLGNRHSILPAAAFAAASSPRSASLTLTLGSSPSSGTTFTAPVKSSSTVYVLVVISVGSPAPVAASRPLRLSSITTQSCGGSASVSSASR